MEAPKPTEVLKPTKTPKPTEMPTSTPVPGIDIEGGKVWNDAGNQHRTRPSSIEVELLRDGVEIDSRVVTAGTNWSFTFQHLPVDDGYGNIYNYEIREDGVNGYFSRIDGTTVTNSLIDGSTPLYAMLGTGDTVPAWVWICGSCGLLALALAILLGKRKRRTN